MPSFAITLTAAAAALAFSASSASASSHYSHSNPALVARDHNRMVTRVLPRTGRRLANRANQATLKCLSDYTFALCDGSNCTDMGSVAAGTKCVNNAITWDTSSEATPQDSTAATVGHKSHPPVPVAPSSSSAAAAVAATTSMTTTTAAPVTTSSSSSPSPSKAAVQLNANQDSSSSSEGDWICDEESTTFTSSDQPRTTTSAGRATSSVATPTGAAATADFASVSSSSSAPATTSASNVQLFVSKAAQTTTTTTTITTSAPAATSAASSSGGAPSPSGNVVEGTATYYYQYGVAGSCGNVNPDSAYIVALSYQIVDNGAHCGQQVYIKNKANGKHITATVADTCPGCDASHLDLSEGAFLALGELATGVLQIEWYFTGN
ncbi:hypothetical protein JCM8202v2_000750 [Rhodotorula sphaerocarpa]